MATLDLIPVDSQFIESHEYARPDDSRARIGISHFAAESLGDIVFVDLPEVGDMVEKGETFGALESVKAASDLYSPISGEVVAINTRLEEEPELINNNCYEDGWIIEVSLQEPNELTDLMNPADYMEFLDSNTSNN